MAKQAQILDGTTRTTLKFDTPADLLHKLKAKGWKSENGDVLLLANSSVEILFEQDLPNGDNLELQLQRRSTGKGNTSAAYLHNRWGRLSPSCAAQA